MGKSALGWDHEHDDGPNEFGICSNWQMVRREGKEYRWKTAITGHLESDPKGSWGLVLTTRLVLQKYTGNWETLSDLVVSRMGDFDLVSYSPKLETPVSYESKKLSPAAKMCRDVAENIEALVRDPTAEPGA